jgi:hypothetical protein
MVTTEMAVARSTVGEAMAVATAVGEEAISRSTTPDRFAEKRFAEMLTTANLAFCLERKQQAEMLKAPDRAPADKRQPEAGAC